MNFWTTLFIVFMIGQLFFYINLFKSKDSRAKAVNKSNRLEQLRKIPVKSVSQQKEFTELLYPKKSPFKFSFKNISTFFVRIVFFIFLFIGFSFFWDVYVGYDFSIFSALFLFLVYPIISDLVLRKFGYQQKNILDLIGRNKLK